MPKPNSRMSLAEQIAALNDPAPSFDPEDASDTETKAKLAEFEDEFEDASDVPSSKLRRRNAGILADDDKRYAGRTTSRRDLDSWDDGVIGSSKQGDDALSSDDDASISDDGSISDDDRMQQYSDSSAEEQLDSDGERRATRNLEDAFRRIRAELDEESSGDDEIGAAEDDDDFDDHGEDSDDNDHDDDSDDDDDDEDGDFHSNQEATSGVQAFSEVSIEEEVAKGKATKAQLTLWDAFIESRIKIQKALAIANQLPAYDKQAAFVQRGGQAVQEMLHSSSGQLKALLKKLIDLQQALLLGNQATRHIVEGKEAVDQKSDEEVTSSDDADGEDDSSPPERSRQRPAMGQRKRKPDTGDLGEFLAKRHKDFQSFQFDTIQKWHEKTRLASGKHSSKSFASFEKSAVSQIEQVLQDKPRLIRRTQLRRTVYTRLGEPEGADDGTQSKEDSQDVTAAGNSHLKEYDEETFDDDDFYHQLLRELIDKRTSSTTDPVQLTRQWLEVQKLRRKIKRKVDTKASKGRKIRYDVHPPLVSFMAGKDTGTMMESARDELFRSLFGRRRNLAEDVL